MGEVKVEVDVEQEPAVITTALYEDLIMIKLMDILTKAIHDGASDVHIVPGHPPMFRIHTHLEPSKDMEVIEANDSHRLVKEMLSEKQLRDFVERRDFDFSTKAGDLGRFRVNAHFQADVIAISFRSITAQVPELEKLNLPSVVSNFVHLPRGLVLVTGPTGSGKSTTLASMIDAMNQHYSSHIITLEDPVEYELKSNKCLIEQREVGSDVTNFASGLRHALRQDPDIILVGEMRDLETTSAAITAAETGHLVLSTMHTQSASQTLARIVDIYPAESQNQVRSMLANTLQAVITQTLFRRVDKPGMVPACEVMVCNAAVRNCIRENRLHEIPNIIETSRAQGMCRLDDSIMNLVVNGRIDRTEGIGRATNPNTLVKKLSA